MKTIEVKQGISVVIEDLAQRISELDDLTLRLFVEQLNEKIHQSVGSDRNLGKMVYTTFTYRPRTQPSRDISEEMLLLEKLKYVKPPQQVVKRYKILRTKAQDESILDNERQEMLCLNHFIEEKSAERLKILLELAQLRKTTLSEVMKQFPLKKYF